MTLSGVSPLCLLISSHLPARVAERQVTGTAFYAQGSPISGSKQAAEPRFLKGLSLPYFPMARRWQRLGSGLAGKATLEIRVWGWKGERRFWSRCGFGVFRGWGVACQTQDTPTPVISPLALMCQLG